MIFAIVMAMLCITGLEAYALYLGINGTYLALGIAAIAGIGGFEVSKLRDFIKGRKP